MLHDLMVQSGKAEDGRIKVYLAVSAAHLTLSTVYLHGRMIIIYSGVA